MVLISHYPVISLAEKVAAAGLPYPGDLLDRADVADALRERNAPTIVVGGHVHVRASRIDGPILQLTVGALIEPPYECAVIDVSITAAGRLIVRRENVRLRGAPTRHRNDQRSQMTVNPIRLTAQVAKMPTRRGPDMLLV